MGQRSRQSKPKAAEDASVVDEGGIRAARIAECIRLLSLRLKPPEIQVKLAEKFGVVERTIRTDLRAARRELAKASESVPLEVRRANYRAGLDLVFQRALEARHFGAALSALDRIARLDALLPEGTNVDVGTQVAAGVLIVPAPISEPERWLAEARASMEGGAITTPERKQET